MSTTDNLAIDTSVLDMRNPEHVQLGILAELQALRKDLRELHRATYEETWINDAILRRYLDGISEALGLELPVVSDLDEHFENLEDSDEDSDR